MNRRHFVKLSSTTAAAILFSRLTSLADNKTNIIHMPDEVWAQSGTDWFKLTASNSSIYIYKDIQVRLRQNENALAVFTVSPTLQLNAVRLKWKHSLNQPTKVLGDHWERSYGDLAWKAPHATAKNPWYVLLHDDKDTTCFGVKTGCNSICWWAVGNDTLELTMDTASGGMGVLLGQRELHAADIVTTQNTANENAFATARRFCKIMCPVQRLAKQPIYGSNDWYFAYGNNSDKLIKELTAIMTDLAPDQDNRPFSVIDAGWAKYSPLLPGDGGWNDDFTKPNGKFKDMHLLADDIKSKGMQPGLWTRLLCAKHDDKKSLLLPSIPGRNDPRQPVLDPTIPENMERAGNIISLYKQWGYKMVKHDFSTFDITGRWGFQMKDSITPSGWSFNDRSKTTAEVINTLYHTIRQSAGDMYINGCNTVGHLSAGVFEQCRIGDDTSGKEWARTRKMGVNTMGFRMVQHNIFYAADGDCVGLTRDVPWAKNKQWMQLLAQSSAPLFISAQPDILGDEQKQYIKQSFAKAAKPQPIGEPLDWLTNPLPSKWKLNGSEVDFDWS